MCGRFTLTTPGEMVAELFGVGAAKTLSPRYNIAPTQGVAAIRKIGAQVDLGLLRWGLIPFWAKDPAIGNRMINARAETVAIKPAYRAAFRSRRCLIPADGFYEWKRTGTTKQPYLIRNATGEPFAMAGLWENWQDPRGKPVESCTIITTAANQLMQDLHDRMPVILPRESHQSWLDPNNADVVQLQKLLGPYAGTDLVALAVTTRVNNPRNDDATCVEPLKPPP